MTDLELEEKRLLDVVNEKDEVIATKSRKEIHELGLLHRDVHVWFFDKEGNIFFQRKGVAVYLAGLFSSTVGGHLNAGEEYLDAAVRETKEETGISIKKEELIFLKKFMNPTKSVDGHLPKIVNNSIRSLYVYKTPIKESMLQPEKGILGVSLQKLAVQFLENISPFQEKYFAEAVLQEELPLVIEYINKNIL